MMITTRPLDARGFSLCGASSHRTIVRMRLQVIFPAGTAVEMYDLLRELSFSSDHNTRIRQCRSIPRGAKKLDFVEDERQFDSAEIEEKITSPDSNRKILEELKTYALEHEQRYGRFPKTLIFAANDLPHTSHSDHLVDTARDIFGRGDSFA